MRIFLDSSEVIYDSSEVVSKFLNLNSTVTFLSSSPEWLLAEERGATDSPNQTYIFPPCESADSPNQTYIFPPCESADSPC